MPYNSQCAMPCTVPFTKPEKRAMLSYQEPLPVTISTLALAIKQAGRTAMAEGAPLKLPSLEKLENLPR